MLLSCVPPRYGIHNTLMISNIIQISKPFTNDLTIELLFYDHMEIDLYRRQIFIFIFLHEF